MNDGARASGSNEAVALKVKFCLTMKGAEVPRLKAATAGTLTVRGSPVRGVEVVFPSPFYIPSMLKNPAVLDTGTSGEGKFRASPPGMLYGLAMGGTWPTAEKQ